MKKRIAACVMCILIIIGNINLVYGEESSGIYTDGDYTYTINTDGTATLETYSGTETNVILPSTIGNGITVTILGCRLFTNNTVVQSVSIPATIINEAYYNYVVASVFEGATNLESISVDVDNPVFYSQDGVLFKRLSGNRLALVKYPNGKKDTSYRIPDGIQVLANVAFVYNPYIQKITVPASVDYTGNATFGSITADIIFLGTDTTIDLIQSRMFINLFSGSRIIVKNSTMEANIRTGMDDTSIANATIINLATVSTEEQAAYVIPAQSLSFSDGTTEKSLSIAPDTIYSMVGSYTHLPADTTEAIAWVSSNPEIATIDATSGQIKGIKTGDTIITGTDESGHCITLNLKVYKAIEDVVLEVGEYTGESDVIGAIAYVSSYDANNAKGVTWSSSNPEVAAVEHCGYFQYNSKMENLADITVKKVGTTTITATVNDEGNVITKSQTLTIRKPLTKCSISEASTQIYTGKAIEPDIVIKDGTATLVKDTDYTITCTDNVAVGVVFYTIQGKGYYTGSVDGSFTIVKADDNKEDGSENSNNGNSGNGDAGNTIVERKSQNITFSSKNVKSSTIKVAYGISPFSLGASAKTSVTYKVSDNKVVTVDNKGKVTVKGTGYATITVTAKQTDAYKQATKTIAVYVSPKQEKVTSLKSNKKAEMTLKWNKDTKAAGYQIQYSTSSKFKSAKSETVSKNTTISKTIKKLTKGKKYYARVRAYKTVKIDGKNVKQYGAWSVAKSVTVKKK